MSKQKKSSPPLPKPSIDDLYLKRSELYTLSSILKRWKRKEFVFNLFNNSVLIRTKRSEKLLYLSSYSVKNLGKFKKKFCFSLESLTIKDPSYIIGCDTQNSLDFWLATLLKNSFNEEAAKKNGIEDYEDLLGNTLMDGVGNSLAPYENFLSKEELLSPSKVLIQTRIPAEMQGLFEKVETWGKSPGGFSEECEKEWQLAYEEIYAEKIFRVYIGMNKAKAVKGRIVLRMNEKSTKDVFKELKDPGSAVLWNKGLFSIEFKAEKDDKIIIVKEIWKPNSFSEDYLETEYRRFHGKTKNCSFLISKNSDFSKDFTEIEPLFPHNKYQYEKIQEKIRGIKELQQVIFIADNPENNGSMTGLEIELVIDKKGLTWEQDCKFLACYLRNFNGLHNLLLPLKVLREKAFSKYEPEIAKENKNARLGNSDVKKEVNKKVFNFKEIQKGNGEFYGTKEQISQFFEYFKSKQYIADCVMYSHNIGLLPENGVILGKNNVDT